MAQVERIEDLQVGDFIQLPRGEWHTNEAAQAMYADAQAFMSAYQGEGLAPQFCVENEPEHNARLERIR